MARLAVCACLLALVASTLARDTSPHAIHAKQVAATERIRNAVRAEAEARLERRADEAKVKNITFTNPKASAFYIDGTTLPLVDFDVGPSWAGLIPISNATNEERKVRILKLSSLLRAVISCFDVTALLLVLPTRPRRLVG